MMDDWVLLANDAKYKIQNKIKKYETKYSGA